MGKKKIHPEIIKFYSVHLSEGRTKSNAIQYCSARGPLWSLKSFLEYGPTISYWLLLVSVCCLFLTGEDMSDLLCFI